MAQILRYRATLQGAGTIPQALITTYWDFTAGTAVQCATEAAARVRACFNALSARIPAAWSLTTPTTADIIEETTGQLQSVTTLTAPSALTFTGASPLLPLQTQAMLQFRTATYINGRNLRGRMYVPGCCVGDLSGGNTWQGVYTTALQSGGNALLSTIVTPINLRVWHRPSVGASNGLSAVVSSVSVRPTPAVLRSRRV
jgi:hypothetical protein